MANVTVTAANVQGTSGDAPDAGVALTAGQVVYRDANGASQLADANGATALQKVDGITLNNGAVGQPVTIHSAQGQPVTIGGSALTPGIFYYLSNTPGAMCPIGDLSTGSKIIQLGFATDANTLTWNVWDTGYIIP